MRRQIIILGVVLLVFLSVVVIAFIYIKLFGAAAPGTDNEVR